MKFFRSKSIKTKQTQFLEAIEGIGDVLVHDVKNKSRGDRVKEMTNEIKLLTLKLFELKAADPAYFKRVLLSEDMHSRLEKNDENARLALAFLPDIYLITLSAPINQLLRIQNTAIENQNSEASRFAVYALVGILEGLANQEDNDVFIEAVLDGITRAAVTAVKSKDDSSYSACIDWFTTTVFFRPSKLAQGFKLQYLPKLSSHFFNISRYVISQDADFIFKEIISRFSHGVHIGRGGEALLWQFTTTLQVSNFGNQNLVGEVRKLVRLLDGVDNYARYKNWWSSFEKLKSSLPGSVPLETRAKLDQLESKLRKAIEDEVKLNNLLEILFGLGAFCLFKEKIDYIKHLWEFKQPHDADSSWVGVDLVPSSPLSVLKLYFGKSSLARSSVPWEDHHGSQIYYKKYFLLLLLRAARNHGLQEVPVFGQLFNMLQPGEIYEIQNSVKGLKSTLLSMSGNEMATLEELGLNNSETANVDTVAAFLSSLENAASAKLNSLKSEGKLESNKLDEFKKNMKDAFYQKATLRRLFAEKGLYENDIGGKASSKAINVYWSQLEDRAAFFDNWFVSYSEVGESYGEVLAEGENVELLKKIFNKCKKSVADINNLPSLLNGSNVFCIAINTNPYTFIQKSQSLEIASQATKEDIQELSLRNKQSGALFRIYDLYVQGIRPCLLVLDAGRLARMVQKNPIDDAIVGAEQLDIFVFHLRAYADDQEFLKTTLEKSSDWLKAQGDKSKQEQALLERVRIDVGERFDLEFSSHFVGHMIKADSDDSL